MEMMKKLDGGRRREGQAWQNLQILHAQGALSWELMCGFLGVSGVLLVCPRRRAPQAGAVETLTLGNVTTPQGRNISAPQPVCRAQLWHVVRRHNILRFTPLHMDR